MGSFLSMPSGNSIWGSRRYYLGPHEVPNLKDLATFYNVSAESIARRNDLLNLPSYQGKRYVNIPYRDDAEEKADKPMDNWTMQWSHRIDRDRIWGIGPPEDRAMKYSKNGKDRKRLPAQPKRSDALNDLSANNVYHDYLQPPVAHAWAEASQAPGRLERYASDPIKEYGYNRALSQKLAANSHSHRPAQLQRHHSFGRERGRAARSDRRPIRDLVVEDLS